jgi:flagellar hook-associated protein 3 FlgL
MGLDRLGTLARSDRSQSFVQSIQGRAFGLQTQITSGYKAQHYSGIAEDAGRLVLLESDKNRIVQYQKSITQIGSRLGSMQVQLESLLDNAIQFRATLVNGLNNGNASFMALGQQAAQMLQQTANVLNTKDGETYLFAGHQTTTAPVDLTKMTGVADKLVVNEDYYQGDTAILSGRIDKDYNMEYGINANAPAFEQYIRSLRLVQQNPTDQGKLSDALSLFDNVISGLNTHIADVGAKQRQLEVSASRHEDNKLVLASTISGIEDTDILDATSRLSKEETLLQAAYASITRLSRISLAQYLN